MTALRLEAHLDDIARSLAEPVPLLVGLDFDGTLAPIVERPAMAALPPDVRASVAELARQPRAIVAVVSGRALSDVRERAGLDHVIYAGNHGLEIEGRGLSFLHPGSDGAAADIARVLADLERGLTGIAGVEIEHKGVTASVHYRRVAPDDVLAVKLVVRRLVHDAASTLICREGKKVLEIRPAIHWHKGAAIRWVRDQLGFEKMGCVYVGDDRTDEDAFQVLPDAITVRVGESADTAARYWVPDTAAVHAFVQWLSERLTHATTTSEMS